jgi:hypothetical protein
MDWNYEYNRQKYQARQFIERGRCPYQKRD